MSGPKPVEFLPPVWEPRIDGAPVEATFKTRGVTPILRFQYKKDAEWWAYQLAQGRPWSVEAVSVTAGTSTDEDDD